MAKQSRGRRALAQLIQGAAQPVYLLDSAAQLVFVNEALCEWTGWRDDALLGMKCIYHSAPMVDDTPGKVDASATVEAHVGLAPAPSCFTEGGRGTVWCYREGHVRQRRATFQRLHEDGGETMLWCVLEPCDLEGSAPGSDPTSRTLLTPDNPFWHQQLVQLRSEIEAGLAFDTLAGPSSDIQRVRRLFRLAANHDVNVVVTGPGGSGFNTVAQQIVNQRCRTPERRFLRLDAPALNDELLRATLLTFWQRGRELKTNDLLFLTDVDQFDAACQATLYELLVQERLGFKIVATSQSPLQSNAQFDPRLANHWREVEIELVPLSQRIEDLPSLAQAFVERLNGKGKKQLDGLSADALDAICRHHWRRDVEEFTEIISSAHEQAAGHEIQVYDLPEIITLSADADRHPRQTNEPINLDSYLESIERELIRRALTTTQDNRAAAARMLGITRSRLLRRIEHLGALLEPSEPTDENSLG